MNDVARALASAYHAQDLQPEHPVRRAIDALQEQDRRISKLEDEAVRHLALARENGQLRDVARRERDETAMLLRSLLLTIEECPSLCPLPVELMVDHVSKKFASMRGDR